MKKQGQIIARRAPQERRERIIDAAGKLFARKGYESTTLADVAKTANVASGTAYLYFKDKAALQIAVVNAQKAKIAALIDTCATTCSGGLNEHVTETVARIFDAVVASPVQSPILPPDRIVALGAQTVEAFAAVDNAIVRLLDHWSEKGLIGDVSCRAAAAMFSGLIMSGAEAVRSGAVPADEMQANIAQMIEAWLKPPHGTG